MPDLIARLTAEIDAMRTGRGPHRQELRERLATIDPALRYARNLEWLRLGRLKARLRMLDTRQDPAPLQAAAEQSARRLAALDLRIVAAIAEQLRPRSP